MYYIVIRRHNQNIMSQVEIAQGQFKKWTERRIIML